MTQNFYGPMGCTRDEIVDQLTTRGRRMLTGADIPKGERLMTEDE